MDGSGGGGGDDEVGAEAAAHRRLTPPLLLFIDVFFAVLTFPSTFPILVLCLMSNCCLCLSAERQHSLPPVSLSRKGFGGVGGGCSDGERRVRRPMDGRIDRSKWRPCRGAGRERGSSAAVWGRRWEGGGK